MTFLSKSLCCSALAMTLTCSGALAQSTGSVLSDLSDPNSGTGPLYLIYTLAFLLPSIAVAIRRLHDTGRTGWWLLLAFIPIIGAIVLIVFYCLDSQPGDNEYGPNPKGVQA